MCCKPGSVGLAGGDSGDCCHCTPPIVSCLVEMKELVCTLGRKRLYTRRLSQYSVSRHVMPVVDQSCSNYMNASQPAWVPDSALWERLQLVMHFYSSPSNCWRVVGSGLRLSHETLLHTLQQSTVGNLG